MSNITCGIPVYKNRENLVAMLIMLQSQSLPPDEIIIIDSSGDNWALDIVKRFDTHTCELIVHNGESTVYESWNKIIELTNKDNNIFFMNDDLLLPHTFIEQFDGEWDELCLVPNTPPRAHYFSYVDEVFNWNQTYNGDAEKAKFLPGFCFMLTRKGIEEVGLFNTDFKVWFGDTDYDIRIKEKGDIVKLKDIYAYHFGAGSYDYKDKATQALIDKDRELFYKLHGKDAKV